MITKDPFDDKIKIEVSVSKPVIFPLYFRIPGWCRNASLKINGRDINAPAVGDSYIRIEKEWRNGDLVELSLPMELSAKIWDKNKNSASINYGSLTFSLKDAKWQADVDQSKWPSFEIFPASQWNYGLLLNANKPLDQQFTVKKVRWPDSNFPFAINDAPISIQAKGKLIPNWTVDKYGLCDTLPVSPLVIDTKPENIELIPMGAARLRISAFPMVKE